MENVFSPKLMAGMFYMVNGRIKAEGIAQLFVQELGFSRHQNGKDEESS